eukprot:TRINITY_DN1126_c0_g1_i4.p2 TRINITY_DN1126_c0_g1~~TRINITY_DN1126_c0_g1_i4.p2  ORF type:complete len:129 (+),score=0.67 TRINITY_DN1126_c0_g1_i4:950-1336(+)
MIFWGVFDSRNRKYLEYKKYFVSPNEIVRIKQCQIYMFGIAIIHTIKVQIIEGLPQKQFDKTNDKCEMQNIKCNSSQQSQNFDIFWKIQNYNILENTILQPLKGSTKHYNLLLFKLMFQCFRKFRIYL